jgi:hypothetical protein
MSETDCVAATASHISLIFNRKAYRAIAHALPQPELTEAVDPVGALKAV